MSFFFICLSFIGQGAFFIGQENGNGINGGEESWDPDEHWETGNGVGNGTGGNPRVYKSAFLAFALYIHKIKLFFASSQIQTLVPVLVGIMCLKRYVRVLVPQLVSLTHDRVWASLIG